MRYSLSIAAIALVLTATLPGFLFVQMPAAPVSGLTIGTHDWVNQTISSSDDLVVSTSGHLVVHNSIYTITQAHPYEFSVTISGTLELVNSTLTSNHPFNVTLQSGGELVMRNSRMEPVGTLSALDGSAEITMDNSEVEVNDTSPLTLKEISMSNSAMPLSPGITADALSFSGVQYDELRVSNCDDLTVASSEIETLWCGLSYKTVTLRGSLFANVTLPNGKAFSVDDCEIDDLSIGVMKTVVLSDSTVGGNIDLQDVNSFSASGCRIESDIEFAKTVHMEDVEVQQLVLRGGGVIIGVSADELIVTSTVQTLLKIYGWEHPTDTTTPSSPSTEGIDVSANARVELYRYLTVRVTDYSGEGVDGAEVIVEDELTSALVANGTTGADGTARIAIKSVEIDSSGEDFVGSVQVHSEYAGKTTQDISLSMNEDRTLTVPMADVNVPGGDDDGWWSWWYLLILVGVLLVVALAAAGGWAYYNYIY